VGDPRPGSLRRDSTEISQDRAGTRINVVGTCGSGKTTVGRRLAERLGLPFVEMDALAWRSDWRLAPYEEIRRLLDTATRAGGWVVDGNYSRFRDLLWGRADTVVWLDLGFVRTFGQLLLRTFGRCITREELWHGNRERLRSALLSRDSILLWGLKTYRRRRRDYPRLLSQPEHAHLRLVHLRTRCEIERWLAGLPQTHHLEWTGEGARTEANPFSAPAPE
jgi:adenylate kinase family enzyme